MIITRQVSMSAFSGAWETWCENKFKGDATNLTKCQSQPFGPFTAPPWTDAGAIQRGLPKPQSLLVSLVQGGGSEEGGGESEQPVSMDAGLFGVPRTIMLAGGAVLVGGLVFAAMKKKRRGRR